MIFIIVGIIIIFILEYNKKIDTKRFIADSEPYFKFLMEEDYKFLLTIKYKEEVDVNKLFGIRIRNGIIVIILLIFIFLSKNELD